MRHHLSIYQKSYSKKIAVLLALLILFSFSTKAQSLLGENFDYPVGNLVGKGEWLQRGSLKTNPLQVADLALTYPGYQDKAIGKSVKLGENGQVAYKAFSDVNTGSVYYSALVCFTETKNQTGDYFLHLGTKDGDITFSARLFARTNANGKLQFGVSRGGTPNSTKFEETYGTAEYEFNQTYLVVVKYTFVSDEKNDEVSLFVNPVINGTEPTPIISRNSETTTDPDAFGGIYIRQPSAKGGASIGNIDALRVSTTWAGLFSSSGEDIPSLTFTPKQLVFGEIFQGDTFSKVVNIKGKNLKGDITVTGMISGDLKVSTTTLAKSEVEAESGFDLTVTLIPTTTEISKDDIIFNSDGLPETKISAIWSTIPFVDVPDLKTLRQKNIEDEWIYYKVTGEVVVSHIYKEGIKTYYYLQDDERGITVLDEYGDLTTAYQKGDKIKNICGTLSSTFGSLSMIPARDFGAPISSGNKIVPTKISLTTLKANPKDYESRLIETEVEFIGVNPDGTALFVEGQNPDITDGTTSAKMRVFKGANYINTPMPVKATLTGISTSGAGNLIAPRDLEDIMVPFVDNGNLFSNAGFEKWTGSPMFGYNPADWESIMGTTFQEESKKLSGKLALRIKTNKLESTLKQEIRLEAPEAFLPGQKYELTLNYYTITSQEGNDISLKSYWRSGGITELTHDKEVLNNGTFFTSVGKWESKTIQTSVPAGASSFYFVLSVPKGGVEVVFDNFSFKKVPSTDPMLTVMPDKVNKLNTNINVPLKSEKIVIYTDNLPQAVSLGVTGQNAAYFTPSVTTIPTNQHVTELTIEYNPKSIGEHTAMLTIECPGMAELTQTIALKGYAIDPANPPLITVSEAGPIAMTAEVGKSSEHSISVSSKNLPDYLYARVMNDDGKGQFIISNTILEKNVDNTPLKITFSPKQQGSFNERIAIYCKTDTVFIALAGTGTQGSIVVEPEGDQFPLDIKNPRALLNEHFDAVTHNKVLKVDGWKNIALKNTRAWWGYNFKNEKEEVTESVAKITAYSSTNLESLPHEMWLVTPPLDFKNAASKIFTFRVMGDLLSETNDALLKLSYMDMQDDTLYTNTIDLKMPSIADENKEWREYHIDLKDQNIADVFFIGFQFQGTGGNVNSAVYYIDDVSFGRTDLPTLTPSKTTLEMEAQINTTITSAAIQIQGKNLSSSIELTVGGPNASKFKASVATLPTAGGSFDISFQSEKEGVHQAYVKISSRGAADVYIPISVNNLKQGGIENMVLDQESEVIVFDYTGKELLRKTIIGSLEQLSKDLENGIYILKTNKGISKFIVNN